LIIFLITIPVVTSSVPVALPQENNQLRDADPAIATIAVDAQGNMYWHDVAVPDIVDLQQRVQWFAAQNPAVQVQIRADSQADFAPVGKVLQMLRTQGVTNIGFVLEPQ